jgi:pantetheine-phosphate adenylyltransferase
LAGSTPCWSWAGRNGSNRSPASGTLALLSGPRAQCNASVSLAFGRAGAREREKKDAAAHRARYYKSRMKRAIYPGSFDPVTFGHLDVIQRALKLFDEVIVAVAFNEQKKSLFTADERVALLTQATGRMGNVRVAQFSGLLVNFAREQEAVALIRGLRAISDFEFEFQMALMNRKLEKSIETLFLMPKEEFTYLSSRIVKEIAALGGNVDAFVDQTVAAALREKFGH